MKIKSDHKLTDRELRLSLTPFAAGASLREVFARLKIQVAEFAEANGKTAGEIMWTITAEAEARP